MPIRSLYLAAMLCCAGAASAQTIERMRLTDGDLSCTQIFAEVQQMDTMIRVMGSAPAAPAPAAGAQAGNAAAPGGFNPLGTLNNVQAASVGQANNAQVQALMRASNDPRVRAAANDPAAVAQTAAMLQNPQLAVAAQRAAAAGVNPSFIQGQLNSVALAQQAANAYQANNQAANGQVPLSAAAGGNNVQIAQNIAAQGQAYAGNVAAGQNWQNALANAQGAAPAPAAAPAASPTQNALGGLFGALASRSGVGGNAQAAGIFGALAQQAQGGANQAPSAAPVAQAVAPAVAAPGGGAPIVAQAQGRKDHLTNLFLTKGCKMSEIQR
jgi:hypothetical protein